MAVAGCSAGVFKGGQGIQPAGSPLHQCAPRPSVPTKSPCLSRSLGRTSLARLLSEPATACNQPPPMRIGKWPCFVATFTLCVLLLQRCSRVEPPPADDVKPLERRYAELHARTLAAAARQHAEMCRVRGATALTDPSGLLGPDAPGFNHARTPRPHAGGRSRSAWSKCSPWQLLSSATVPRQEAPGGSWQLGTPRVRPRHWAPSRLLTHQAASVRRCATSLVPQLSLTRLGLTLRLQVPGVTPVGTRVPPHRPPTPGRTRQRALR